MAYEINEFKHNDRQVSGSDYNSVVKGIDDTARTITLAPLTNPVTVSFSSDFSEGKAQPFSIDDIIL